MNRVWQRTALALWILLGAASAAADNVYQIELVVFARDSAEAEAEEQWHNDYSLRYPERLVTLHGAAEGTAAPFQLLPQSAQQLRREAALIAQRKSMRVLFHGAWQQPVGEAARATGVFISGGQQFGAHQELEGFVALSVERYLHINTQLWLSRFTERSNAPADAPLLPQPPRGALEAAADPYAVSHIYVLQEHRKMRSGELHYQDHPRLGTLVLVTPIPAPAVPAAAAAAP